MRAIYKTCFTNVNLDQFLQDRLDLLSEQSRKDCGLTPSVVCELGQTKNKVFLIVVRHFGTTICAERDALIDRSAAYYTALLVNKLPPVWAFLVEITDISSPDIIGNVFIPNLDDYAARIKAAAVDQKHHVVTYEDGYKETWRPGVSPFGPSEHGHIVAEEYIPTDKALLENAMEKMSENRAAFVAKMQKSLKGGVV